LSAARMSAKFRGWRGFAAYVMGIALLSSDKITGPAPVAIRDRAIDFCHIMPRDDGVMAAAAASLR
jgi:hypothetical protein